MTACRTFIRTRVLPLLAAITLAACGGGGEGDASAVTNISAANMRLTSTGAISASGRNLSSASMRVEGACTNLTRVASSTDDLLQYTCDVQALGAVRIYVVNASGQDIGDVTAEVLQPRVSVSTSKGNFVIDLDAALAPKTVLNFLAYVKAGFYTNTLIDTARPGRGIMGGAFTLDANTGALTAKTTSRQPIELESANGLKHVRGAVGMFRTLAANSATFRWFVDAGDNADLNYVDANNPGYVVFGHVSAGLDVVDGIAAVDVRPDLVLGLTDVPVTAVRILSILQTR